MISSPNSENNVDDDDSNKLPQMKFQVILPQLEELEEKIWTRSENTPHFGIFVLNRSFIQQLVLKNPGFYIEIELVSDEGVILTRRGNDFLFLNLTYEEPNFVFMDDFLYENAAQLFDSQSIKVFFHEKTSIYDLRNAYSSIKSRNMIPLSILSKMLYARVDMSQNDGILIPIPFIEDVFPYSLYNSLKKRLQEYLPDKLAEYYAYNIQKITTLKLIEYYENFVVYIENPDVIVDIFDFIHKNIPNSNPAVFFSHLNDLISYLLDNSFMYIINSSIGHRLTKSICNLDQKLPQFSVEPQNQLIPLWGQFFNEVEAQYLKVVDYDTKRLTEILVKNGIETAKVLGDFLIDFLQGQYSEEANSYFGMNMDGLLHSGVRFLKENASLSNVFRAKSDSDHSLRLFVMSQFVNDYISNNDKVPPWAQNGDFNGIQFLQSIIDPQEAPKRK